MLNGTKMWITNGPIASGCPSLQVCLAYLALHCRCHGAWQRCPASARSCCTAGQPRLAAACHSAGTVIVYAKTDTAAGSHGITAFIVEKGMPVGVQRHMKDS